jgi:hypothetical protein
MDFLGSWQTLLVSISTSHRSPARMIVVVLRLVLGFSHAFGDVFCSSLLESFQADLSHGDALCLAFVLIELSSVVG